MSVYYQTSPPASLASPARVYYPSSSRSRRNSSYYAGSGYSQPYNGYTQASYSPALNQNGLYYQPGQTAVQYQVAQPGYTAPMVYNYLQPRNRLHRLYRGRRHNIYAYYGNASYGDIGCCGCGDEAGGGGCFGCSGGRNRRWNGYAYEDEDGCCGCCGPSYNSGRHYYGRRRHDEGCCDCCEGC